MHVEVQCCARPHPYDHFTTICYRSGYMAAHGHGPVRCLSRGNRVPSHAPQTAPACAQHSILEQKFKETWAGLPSPRLEVPPVRNSALIVRQPNADTERIQLRQDGSGRDTGFRLRSDDAVSVRAIWRLKPKLIKGIPSSDPPSTS